MKSPSTAAPDPVFATGAPFDIDALELVSRTRVRWPVAPGMLAETFAVLVGRARRPRVVLVAGVHGDEMEGILALHELCRTLPLTELVGTLVAIPIANPTAFAGLQRRVPIDGADLNRTFPGQAEGSFSDRLAAALFGWVQGADF